MPVTQKELEEVESGPVSVQREVEGDTSSWLTASQGPRLTHTLFCTADTYALHGGWH